MGRLLTLPRSSEPDAISWKPYAYSKDGEDPTVAGPFLPDGNPFAPLLGIGPRRIEIRAFRLAENEKGQPIRETWTSEAGHQWPLEVEWTDPEDQPPEAVCRIPGLPGWWIVHPVVLAC